MLQAKPGAVTKFTKPGDHLLAQALYSRGFNFLNTFKVTQTSIPKNSIISMAKVACTFYLAIQILEHRNKPL